MKICVLSDQIYPDTMGGIGKSVFDECAALVKRGHSVSVFVRAADHHLPKTSTIEGVNITRFWGPKRQYLYYFYPLAVFYHTIRWLRVQQGWDLLYIHNPLYVMAAILSGVGFNLPMVDTFYASMADEIRVSAAYGKYGQFGALARLGANIIKGFENWAYSHVDMMLPRSRYSLRDLKRLFPFARVPERLVPLGVDARRYFPGNKLDARTAFGLPANRPILITVRRLAGRMGLSQLIDAMQIVRQSYPEVLLLIAGKGYLQPTLESQIHSLNLENHVRLLGFVLEADLPRYLVAANLFVLPTESLEGFGLVTIEAFATGLPVIGTPVGATPEILTPLDPNLLTADASPEALADKIKYWLGNQEQLHELGQRCRQIVEAQYSADVVAQHLEQVFSKVIELHTQH